MNLGSGMGDQDHICHGLLQRYMVSQAILVEAVCQRTSLQSSPILRPLSHVSQDLKHRAGLWKEEAVSSGQQIYHNSTLWSSTDSAKTWQQGRETERACPVWWLDLVCSVLPSPSSPAAPSSECTNRLGITTTVNDSLHILEKTGLCNVRFSLKIQKLYLSAKQLFQCWEGRQGKGSQRGWNCNIL